jgi:hypothetical protein
MSDVARIGGRDIPSRDRLPTAWCTYSLRDRDKDFPAEM